MGQYSWIDCKNEERAILDGKKTDSYVLVPKEFQNTYGERIKEECYGGYGYFGGYDIYELAALWNRNYINTEDFGKSKRINDFISGLDDETMRERYDDDYLRNIGIDIACYDEQNAALKYPIKITHDKDAVYEDCNPSKSDPNQGWGRYSRTADKDFNYMDYEELKSTYDKSNDPLERLALDAYMQDEYSEEYEAEFLTHDEEELE